jgi:nucleolar MIF4G domain-containing protein 1
MKPSYQPHFLMSDLAAHFVETCISKYEFHYASLSPHTPGTDRSEPGEEDQGKECMNLIILISELYNFQVISCVLIYDLIRALLAGTLNEINVELLLKITRSESLLN